MPKIPSLIFVVLKTFHHLDSLGLLLCYISHTYENKPVKRNYVAIGVRSFRIMLVLITNLAGMQCNILSFDGICSHVAIIEQTTT